VAQAPTAPSKTKQVVEETKARVQEFKDSGQLKELQSPSKTEQQNKGIAGSQPDAVATAPAQNQIRSPATLSPTPLQEKSSAGEAASPRLEQSPPPARSQAKGDSPLVLQPEKENASKDAAAAGRPLLPPEARGRSATPSISALRSGAVVGVVPFSGHELAIRLKEPARDEKATADRLASGGATAERRSLTAPEEAKSLDQARQQTIQTGQSQIVWVTIARDQYERFKKELADLGSIEVEVFTANPQDNAVAKSSDRLRIKVTILPPLASGNPVPSQP
jgi:hypothetical protein